MNTAAPPLKRREFLKRAAQRASGLDRYVSLLHRPRFQGPLLLHGLSEAQLPGCVAFLREMLMTAATAAPAM